MVVHVLEGGTQVETASGTVKEGKWSATLATALKAGKNTFTAFATEKSGLGNEEGESSSVSFEVDTLAPSVTIVGPPSPSKNQMPSFSGTAGEAGEVVVHVLEAGKQVETASGTVKEGKWSATLATALKTGKTTFTAYATEASGLDNEEGKSSTVTFEVNTEPPALTIVAPPSPSKNQMPSFSGTASEAGEVVVHVLEGGKQVETASGAVKEGKWSATLGTALKAGKTTFTAFATEKSGLGNGEGESLPVSFEVNTEAPVVTIAAPASPSKVQTPTFKGTASEAGEVVVHVLEAGKQVETAAGTVKEGKWSATLATALKSGKNTFTAFATEVSGLGNEEGESGTVSFEVDTLAPTVTIVAPASPSKVQTPSFSGTASEAGEVVVHVLEAGKQVETASGTVKEGKWSATLATALKSGKNTFTAFATEKSGLGNAEGESGTVTFEVNTLPPAVTIVAPPSPSKNQMPSFSGTASEAGEVVVHVLEGTKAVETASGTVKEGKWSATLATALKTGKNTFTAFATEKSGLGNAEGESLTVSFEVNTEPPVVTIVGPKSPSNVQTPSFSGTASEAGEVVVHVLEAGKPVETASGTVEEGKWSATLATALKSGKNTFTALATEKSGLGNEEGKSSEVSFVVNTEPPVVTIVAPPTPTNNTNPPFSGTASEETEVEVHVFVGTSEVDSGKTTASGGKWSLMLAKLLPSGKNRFTADATEKSGLGNAEGKSTPAISFEVNTEPPAVLLESPALVSSNQSPSFAGTASETLPVTVEVFKSPKVEGSKAVAKIVATVSAGHFKTSPIPSELLEGQYVASATEASSLGNGPGRATP